MDNDARIYRTLLETDELAEHHLAPLARTPCKHWRRKALTALGNGYSVDDIVSASVNRRDWSWSGPMHQMWAEWKTAFDALLDDADPRIVRIGKQGAEKLEERERKALEIERYEDVHGLG